MTAKRSIDAPSLPILGGLSALLLLYALAPALLEHGGADQSLLGHHGSGKSLLEHDGARKLLQASQELSPPVLMSCRDATGAHFAVAHWRSRMWVLHLVFGFVFDKFSRADDAQSGLGPPDVRPGCARELTMQSLAAR